jgi:hypothetical protein
VQVTKEGEDEAPEDGLVIMTTDTARYRLMPDMPDEPLLFENEIQWSWRILKHDGTFGNWTAYQNGQGHTFTAQPATAGIYEVKAEMDGQEFFLKRAKDDPHSARMKGENDCFGVVDEPWQISVRHEAKKNLGSTAYAAAIENPPFAEGEPKCNLFVAHKATDGGAIVPWIKGNFIRPYPPIANQWEGHDSQPIPNWTLLPEQTFPQPGFIVARIGQVNPNTGSRRSGHVGILDYDGAWIAAGTLDVNRRADLQDEISLRSGDLETIYQPAKFRK